MSAKRKQLSLAGYGALGLGIVLAGSLGIPEAAFGQAQDAADKGTILEEIVVTSRKRTESLEAIPISVTAFSSARLEDLGVVDLHDLDSFVPNLAMDDFAGRANSAIIFIRGVGGGNNNAADRQSGVGIYMDGVYMPRTNGGYVATVDVERIEVLRGPQGTLFGKNTTGGAVNYISKKPGPDFESTWTFRVGNYARKDARGTVNMPLIENKVYARLAGLFESHRGFFTELNTGLGYSNRKRTAVRGAVRFLPNEHLTIDIAGTYANQPERPQGAVCVWDSLGFFQIVAAGTDNVVFKDECKGDIKGRTFTSDLVGFSHTQVWGINTQTTWDALGPVLFFDELQVKLLAAWRGQSASFLEDSDWTAARIETRGRVDPTLTEQRTLELQMIGQALDNRLSFVGGLYWADDISKDAGNDCQDEIATIDLAAGESVLCSAPGGFHFTLLPAVPFVQLLAQIYGKIETKSIYANATMAVTESISLTFGARHTWETRSFRRFDFDGVDFTGLATRVILSEDNINFNNVGKQTWTKWTPTASVSLALPSVGPIESGNLYFTYAKGFQSGGFNQEFPEEILGEAFFYGPETVDSFEIGLKTTLAGGRARFSIAGFMSNFKDKQETTLIDNVGPFANLDPGLTLVTNAATMSSDGLEMEFTAIPVENMLINFSLGYLHTRFDEFLNFDPVLQMVVDDSDRRVGTLTPDWQINGSVEYDFVLAGGSVVTPRIVGQYRSGYEYGPNARHGDPKTFLYEGPWTKWDAYISWLSPSGTIKATLFGRNIFNKDTFRSGSTIQGGSRGWTKVFLDAPAMYGFELQFVYN